MGNLLHGRGLHNLRKISLENIVCCFSFGKKYLMSGGVMMWEESEGKDETQKLL